MKIYIASSWRNQYQPSVVLALRSAGHDVYDFRHPAPDDDGFRWLEIEPQWQSWSPAEYLRALQHPIAIAGFRKDMDALQNCDACVLVMPAGRSAHVELGFACGAGKITAILIPEPCEPELMYRMADFACTEISELVEALEAASRESVKSA